MVEFRRAKGDATRHTICIAAVQGHRDLKLVEGLMGSG
jgi:hypothetical protein